MLTMIKLSAVFPLAGLLLLAGCARMGSLQPLVTADDAAPVDAAYTGIWKSCEDNKDLWKVDTSDERTYSYRGLDKDGGKGRFRLVEIDGQWFADIEPEGGVVPAHVLAR